MYGCQSRDSFFLAILAIRAFPGALRSPLPGVEVGQSQPHPWEPVVLWGDRSLRVKEGQGLPREDLSWLWDI